MLVSTVPVITTVTLPDKSVAEAPSSVYVPPTTTVTVAAPFKVTTGLVVSTTLTVLVALEVFPDESVAE